jgi:hypothetical protein
MFLLNIPNFSTNTRRFPLNIQNFSINTHISTLNTLNFFINTHMSTLNIPKFFSNNYLRILTPFSINNYLMILIPFSTNILNKLLLIRSCLKILRFCFTNSCLETYGITSISRFNMETAQVPIYSYKVPFNLDTLMYKYLHIYLNTLITTGWGETVSSGKFPRPVTTPGKSCQAVCWARTAIHTSKISHINHFIV